MISSKKLFTYFLIFIGVIIIIVLVIGSFVISKFKESEAYQTAVIHAKKNVQIQVETGGVTKVGYLVGGKLTDRSAELNFKLHGEKKDLNMYYQLTKSVDGTWVVEMFSIEKE